MGFLETTNVYIKCFTALTLLYFHSFFPLHDCMSYNLVYFLYALPKALG